MLILHSIICKVLSTITFARLHLNNILSPMYRRMNRNWLEIVVIWNCFSFNEHISVCACVWILHTIFVSMPNNGLETNIQIHDESNEVYICKSSTKHFMVSAMPAFPFFCFVWFYFQIKNTWNEHKLVGLYFSHALNSVKRSFYDHHSTKIFLLRF